MGAPGLRTCRLVAGHRPRRQRDLTAVEVGHAAMVRHTARLRLGLTAHDEMVAAARTPSGRLWFCGLQAEEGRWRLRSPLGDHGRAATQVLGPPGPGVGL